MANTIKITCTNASFVDKHNPLQNYSKFDTLSAGLVNTRLSGFHLFKSVLNFNVPKIQADKITNAYLFIFIKRLQYSVNAPESIGICGNYSNVDTSSVLWDTFPTEKFTPVFHLNIPKDSSESYVKINITEILKELCINDEYYNLVLCPIDSKSQIITAFSAPSSDNPPYLKIEYDKAVSDSVPNNSVKKEPINTSKLVNHSNTRSDNPHISSFDKNQTQKFMDTIYADLAAQSKSLLSLQNKLEVCPSKEIIKDISEKLETQNQEFSSFKSDFNKICSSFDFNSMIEIITSISDKINLLPEICSCDDLKIISDSIGALSENITSCTNILADLNETVSNSSVPINIENAVNLINELKANMLLQNDNIETIFKKIDAANISLEKISENENAYNDYLSSIRESLTNQTENINSLKDTISHGFSDNSNLLDQKHEDISNQIQLSNNKINSLSNEISNLFEKNTLLLTAITSSLENSKINPGDISLISNTINEIQSNVIELNNEITSLKDLIPNNCIDNTNLINKNHDYIISQLQINNNNINTLESHITGLFEKNTDNLELINTNYDNILNQVQLNSSSLDSLKAIISTFADDNINFINNNYKNILAQIESNNSSVNSLETNIIGLFKKNTELLTLINNSLDSSNITPEDISGINDNIEKTQEPIIKLNDKVNSLQDFITNLAINTEDIINTNSKNIYTKLQSNDDTLDSLKTIISDLSSDSINLITTNYQSVYDKLETITNNLNLLKDIFSNSAADNTDLLKDNYNNIISKIQSNNDLLTDTHNDISNYIQSASQNLNSYKDEFTTLSSAINCINEKLHLIDSLDERLTAYEEAEKTNSGNILCLLNNINLLNKEIINLKDSMLPIKDNVLELNVEVSTIKDSINNMCNKAESGSNNSSNYNLDEINNKLSDLSASINQILNALSDLTIDPLN